MILTCQVADDDVLDLSWTTLEDAEVDCGNFDGSDFNFDPVQLTTKVEQRLHDGKHLDGSPPIGLF